MYTLLITAEQLKALQAEGARLMVFDCSFELSNPAAGDEQYREAHIPGAVHADLDAALSDQGVVDPDGTHHPHADAASGGRHPLPSREKFAMWLSSVGFANDMQAVVYDRQNASYCGRLWWMLKWAGHEAVAVLDGGLAGLAGRWRRGQRPARSRRTSSPTSGSARPCGGWCARTMCWPRWRAGGRRWWMPAPRRATAAKSSRSTRWRATFRAP